MQHEFPLLLAGQHIQRPDRAGGIVTGQRLLAAAEERLALFVFDIRFVVNGSHQPGGYEKLLCFRIVGRAEPVRGALQTRPDQVAVVGGSVPGMTIGRPASSRPVAQVCFEYSLPCRNSPVSRSSK